MHRTTASHRITSSLFVLGLSWLMAAGTALATTATPSGCANFASIGMDTYCISTPDTNTPTITGQTVVPGQTIYYQVTLNRAPTQCCVTGGVVRITTPDGVDHLVGNVGATLICNPADGVGGSIASIVFPTIAYTVRAEDMGMQHGAGPCDPASISVQASCTYTGGVNFCDGTCSATASTDNCNPTLIPSLIVTKLVACTTGTVCDASLSYGSSASGAIADGVDPNFCYSITLTNSGTAPLSITNVSDSVLGDLTASFPAALLPNTGTNILIGPITESVTTIDTVTVLGFEPVSCIQQAIGAESSATAQVVNAAIAVTKECNGGPFNIGDPIQFTGTVTNTGDATLTGITVIDDKAGDVSASLSSATLAPGASATFSGSYAAEGNGCGPFTNTVIASGTFNLDCSGTVQATTNNVCTVITSPDIAVTKLCDGGPFEIGQPIKFTGTVSNPGDVTLVNVMVVDNQAGSVLSGVTLAPGASTNYSGMYVAEGCGPFTNTVTATGTDFCTGEPVQAQAQSVCTVITSPGIAVTKLCDGGPFVLGDPIKFIGTVTNTGDVTLVNVMVVDNQAGSVLSGVTLAPGASTNYSGMYVAEGCGPFTNTVTATGTDSCSAEPVQAQAQSVCTVITSPGIAVTKVCDGGPFVLGDPIKFIGTVTNTGDVTLVNVMVVDNQAGSVLSGVTLAPNASTNYSGSYAAGEGCGPFTNTVTATGTDLCTGGPVQAQAQSVCTVITSPGIAVTKSCMSTNGMIHFTGTVTNTGDVTLVNVMVVDDHAGSVLSGVTLASNASTNYSGSYSATSLVSTDTVTATGTDLCTGGQVQAQAMAVCGFNPCIQITKSVECNTTGTNCSALADYGSVAQGAADATHVPTFCFRYAVTNCGDQVIEITNVVDSAFGDITGIGFPNVLAPGESTNVFISADLGSSVINIVDLQGAVQGAPGLGGVNSSSTATAQVLQSIVTCNVVFERNNEVLSGNVCSDNKNVGVQFGGGAVDVHVVVCADSENLQSLTNCVVTLTGVPGAPIMTTIPGATTPGNCADIIVTTLPDAVSMYNVRADVSCEGVLTHSCGEIETVCSNSISICGTNCLSITKLVKCLSPDEDAACSSDINEYGKSATGVSGASFCYAMIVSNCGELALSPVNVTDPTLGVSTTIPTLDANASSTLILSPVNFGNAGANHDTNIVNTATAIGVSTVTSQVLTSMDTAVVRLLPITITCDKLVSLDGGTPRAGGVEVPNDGSVHTVAYYVQVSAGEVALKNIVVSDDGCDTEFEIPSLAAGSTTELIPLCEKTFQCTNVDQVATNTVTVSGEVDLSGGICGVDQNGQVIKTSSSCSAIVTVPACLQKGCRTTGGGKQPAQDTCPEVRYVTHGGQVGAPFAEASAPDCATGIGFNNPCIRGEYQHVRHIKGGLRGTFHAAGNGNQHDFDSLMCACLPCEHTDIPSPFGGCHPADRVYASENPTVPGKHFGLCNPDEPKNGCGPEPRPAPANKICFSGVADYTMTRGKKTPQSVVFRVDLEDRSEPGGAHPKGGKAPPDRYRMRMWFIAAGSADTAAVKALRATVACKDALTEVIPSTLDCLGSPTPAPDIDDGGDLDRGNRQIHPTTGATCD